MALWLVWKLEPNDAITHCYVKCALTGLQIYDEKENAIKSERIPVQYQAYKNFTQATPREVSAFQEALAAVNPKNGSCVDLYTAYIPVHNRFVNVSRQLYHGKVEITDKIYAAMPNIKRKSESFHAYCEKLEKPSEWKNGRNYELTDSPQLKKTIDCIFRGLRYMDDTGLKVEEIVRDFNLINQSKLEPEVRSVLASCEGNGAYHYYSCLVESHLKKHFKNAFDFHELRSADYGYLLLGNVYRGPENVREELKKLSTTSHL